MSPINQTQSTRLKRLEITNFKALDSLVLEFPPLLTPSDPDIFMTYVFFSLSTT